MCESQKVDTSKFKVRNKSKFKETRIILYGKICSANTRYSVVSLLKT